MLRCASREFGVIEYDTSTLISFPRGLPGFESERLFVPIEREATKPVLFLQSLVSPDLCFLTLPVEAIDPNYRIALSVDDLNVIGIAAEADKSLRCLALVCAGEKGSPTVNLLGPLVINPETRQGVQAIRDDSDYSVQHPLFPGPEAPKCL